MAIKVGDVYILKGQIDRVKGYGPDKVAFSDYYPIAEGSKVTVLEIEGNKTTVLFKKRTEISGGNWVESKGIQEIETDALYNAADVYGGSSSTIIILSIRAMDLIFRAVKMTVRS